MKNLIFLFLNPSKGSERFPFFSGWIYFSSRKFGHFPAEHVLIFGGNLGSKKAPPQLGPAGPRRLGLRLGSPLGNYLAPSCDA